MWSVRRCLFDLQCHLLRKPTCARPFMAVLGVNKDEQVVRRRYRVGRRTCVIETAQESADGLMRPPADALPTAIASPTRLDDRRNLYPAHFSAIHFSAIPLFVFFRSFRPSPKNHLSLLSVSRKKEKKTKKGASLCCRLFAVRILAWQLRRRLHPRRDCFLHGPGRPATIFPHPHFSASHFSAIGSFAFFRFFCYHRNSLCARPAWRGLSALIYLAGRTLPGALPQAGIDRAFGPYCHCSATRAPTARPIPPWGNAPRKAAPPPHLRRYKG